MAIEFLYRNEARKISQVPDWSDSAQAGDHLWQPTSISGDFCYVGESECSVRYRNNFFCLPFIIIRALSYEVLSQRECVFINHNFFSQFVICFCYSFIFSSLFSCHFVVHELQTIYIETRTAHEVFSMQNGGSYQLHFDYYESNTIVMQTIIQRRKHTAIR